MYRLLKPLLFRVPAEMAHEHAMTFFRLMQKVPGFCSTLGWLNRSPEELKRELFGLTFPNPIGLAAGFDKDAKIIPLLSNAGFGFLEVGTVTPLPQPGNPKPRLFRFPQEEAILNRMGFNNAGADAMAVRLKKRRLRQHITTPIGINLGKNKITPEEDAPRDYALAFERLKDLGDYFVVNVSSPNTPGLRNLQSTKSLEDILKAMKNVCDAIVPPILLKLAPDLENDEIITIAEAAADIGYAGIILTNTTLSREKVSKAIPFGAGGISGQPLRDRSREILQLAHKATSLPIISVGGINSTEETLWRLDHGASLVQIYSALIYQGPFLPRRIMRGLAESRS